MKKNIYSVFWLKNRKIFQVIFAMLVVFICWHPSIYLHPFSALILICGCFTLHTYIENKVKLKKLQFKYSKQWEIITTLYQNSEELIIYRDVKGNFVYCNKQYLDVFNLTLKDIKGKFSFDYFSSRDARILKMIHKKATKGIVVNRVLILGQNAQKYSLLVTPIVVNDEIEGVLTIAKNITQKEYLRKELERQEQLLRSILDNMPVATYLKDLDGNITYENSMAKDFLGLSDSEYSNKWEYEANRINEIEVEDNEVLNNKACIERDKRITLKNNDQRWFNVTKCPIFDNNKAITGILCVAKDIESAKKVQGQRETYVATLTHDLKTPTIAQIKALDLLLSGAMGEFDKEQKDMLILIKDSCNYMYEMLTNLLSTYKYENGDYVLNYETVNIVALIEEACQELNSLVKEKNMKICIKNPDNIGDNRFDKMQIKRVIMNFLGNAIAYAYNDTDIEVILQKQDNFIKIEIINYSPYINPSLLKNLFQKYVTHAAKHNKIGVGLGLYLSKQIVNAHNGEVKATSYIENKNVFEFTLPISL